MVAPRDSPLSVADEVDTKRRSLFTDHRDRIDLNDRNLIPAELGLASNA